MRDKTISISALALSLAALIITLQQRQSLQRDVESIVDNRERNYSQQLAEPLNKSREMMGFKSVNPTNFAGVLNAYFQSIANVLDNGPLDITNQPNKVNSTNQP